MNLGQFCRWSVVVMVAFALQIPALALAEDESVDLPARVGRVSDVAGELFLATQEHADEWAPIGLNYPVTSGDNLWVSANGRAEIDYGGGRFRLAGDTNLHVNALDDRQLALFVASGKVIVRVRSLEPGEVARIETPNTQIDIDHPGQYRVDVDAGQERTTLTVRAGEAGIRFAGGVQQTLPGQAATVMGIDGAGLAIQNGFGNDGFDTWSAARDLRYESGRGPAYVSPDMVGARDLDDYGTWESTQSYGPVWYPSTVAVGWAPYRFGNWTWVAPWGWTWVDAAPWGYAPFHYGRWVWVSGRWGWCPGTRFARPVWAPALVGWYGGHGWATGGPPVYGWVPLGWGEPYLPSWSRCSGNCWRKLNEPYAVAQTDRRVVATPQRYANSTVPGAMTAVSAAVLTGARPVAPNQINVSTLPGATPPVLAGAPNVTPLARQGIARPTAAPVPASAQYRMLRSRQCEGGDSPARFPDGGCAPAIRAPGRREPGNAIAALCRARGAHPGQRWQNCSYATGAGDAQVRRADASNAVIDDTADVWWCARKSGRIHGRSADARSEGPGGGGSRHRGSGNRAIGAAPRTCHGRGTGDTPGRNDSAGPPRRAARRCRCASYGSDEITPRGGGGSYRQRGWRAAGKIESPARVRVAPCARSIGQQGQAIVAIYPDPVAFAQSRFCAL